MCTHMCLLGIFVGYGLMTHSALKIKILYCKIVPPEKLYCLLGLKSMVVDALLDRHRRRASQVEGEQVQKHGGMKLLV